MSTENEYVLRVLIDVAQRLRRATREQRREGREFLFFAHQWFKMGCYDHALIAAKNAVSVFRPLWSVERMRPSRG